MCLRAGVLPLSYSSFVPSMNCLSPIGTANLSLKIGLSKGPRHTGTACPFERVWRSLPAVAPSARDSSVRALCSYRWILRAW